MTTPRLSSQGANAKAPAKLPALQTLRSGDDPVQVQKAIEAIREWVEVRLGSRGDPYETAVTLRDLLQKLAPLEKTIAEVKDALMVQLLPALPPLQQGASVQIGDDLYYCNGKAWKRFTLV